MESERKTSTSADSNRSNLLRHGIWVFVGRLSNVAIAALSTFVVARLLSQTEFGRFSSMLAATQLLSLVGIFGLDQAVIREVGKILAGKNSVQIRPLLRSFAKLSIYAQLASALIACLFLYFSGSTLVKETVTGGALLATVLFTVIRSVIQTAGETARALDDPIGANILGGTAGGALGTAGFLALIALLSKYREIDWGTAMGLYFTASTLPLLILLFRIRRATQKYPADEMAASPAISMKELVRQAAIPLFLISVVAFGSSRADVLLLSFFRGPDEVAIYEAARRLTLLLTIPLGLMNMVVVTSISRLYNEDKREELQRILQTASAIASIPCLIACAAFLLIPEWILMVCFGEKYVDAAPILRILVPGQLIFVLSGTCGLTLMHTGHAHVALWVSGIGTAFVLLGGPFAIWIFGIYGIAAIISTVIGLQNAANWWYAGRLSHIWTHPKLFI